MKVFLFKVMAFYCFMAGGLMAHAQCQSVAAGQTAGMIVTVFNPSQFMWNFHPYGVIGGANIDLNNDGVIDVVISANDYYSTPYERITHILTSTNNSIQFATKIDSGVGIDSGLYYVTRLFAPGDTILCHAVEWSSDSAIVYEYFGVAFGASGSIGIEPAANYYLAGRLCSVLDTALFYIHVATDSNQNTNLLDYAIQGTDTTSTSTFVAAVKKDEEVKIYPDPVLNLLQAQVDKELPFELCNVLGEKVKVGKLVSGLNQIDMAAFSPGIYFLSIAAQRGMVQKVWKAN